MAELPALRRRLRSVSSTKQITKAMQLVAASKLRRAEISAAGPASYLETIGQLLDRLGASRAETRDHPLFQQRPIQHGLIIAISADRGMTGSYNSAIIKAVAREVEAENAICSLICIGRRSAQHIAGIDDLQELAAYDIDNPADASTLTQSILREATEHFIDQTFDSVHLIYTRFWSTIRQEVVTEALLPLSSTGQPTTTGQTEPDLTTVIDVLSQQYLEARLAWAIAQSRASEQAARMIAMMKASDNAADLIEDLTLTYNDARQTAITQELAEISAGVEVMNG